MVQMNHTLLYNKAICPLYMYMYKKYVLIIKFKHSNSKISYIIYSYYIHNYTYDNSHNHT